LPAKPHNATINKLVSNTINMKIKVTNSDWREKIVVIKNKTVRTLSNGVVIPTWSAMVREVSKI